MANLRDTRMPNATGCPFCGHQVDSAMAAPANSDSAPSDGDVAICIRCAEPAVYVAYGGQFQLRKPTRAEAESLSADPQIAHLRQAVREAQRRVGRRP